MSGFNDAAGGHVFVTSTTGSTWNYISPAVNVPFDGLALDGASSPTTIYAGTDLGVLRSIDTDAARDLLGVRAIITVKELDAAGIRNMPAAGGKHRDGSPIPRPAQRPLATDRVHYVGEPIAMAVAETAKQAKDAAEAVFARYRPAARGHDGKRRGGA